MTEKIDRKNRQKLQITIFWIDVQLNYAHLVGILQMLRVVRDQHANLTLQVAIDAVGEQKLCHGTVDRTQRVVEQKDVGVWVEGARHADSRALPATQVDAALGRQRVLGEGQQRKVLGQRARLDHPLEFRLVPGVAEQNVLLDACRE